MPASLTSVSAIHLPTYNGAIPPPPADRALTSTRRGPASVSSRSTGTRRHRSSRSHHSGNAFRSQNEFPNFAVSGDVEIILSAEGVPERRYMLHRLILSQCSGFFDASTSDDWSRASDARIPGAATDVGGSTGSALSSIGEDDESGSTISQTRRPSLSSAPGGPARQVWRYELDWGTSPNEPPMLVQKVQPPSLFGGNYAAPPPPPLPRTSQAGTGVLRNLGSAGMASAAHIPSTSLHKNNNPTLSAQIELLNDYDNLFRIFYNHSPTLDSLNIAEAYLQCKSLLSLADMYDALPVVGPRIDHHLLQFQSRLWKQIAKYPPSYLKLGYLARSRVIFQEALIHVVGQWPSGTRQLGSLPEQVLDLIEDKVDDLKERRMRAENRLFRVSLTNPKTGERVGPATGYLDWLAVSLFRQWIADNTTSPSPPPPPSSSSAIPPAPGQPHHPTTDLHHHHHQQHTTSTSAAHNRSTTSPSSSSSSQSLSPGTFYRLLSSPLPSAYLSHDDLKRFLRTTPGLEHNRETLRRLEKRVEEVKGMAREVVRATGLARSYLEGDVGRGGGEGGGYGGLMGYLVCTRVEEGEWPWDD